MSRLTRTAAALAATAAVTAAGAGSAQAAVPCFKSFPASSGNWTIQNDGSAQGALLVSGGSFLDENHGRLTVAGVTFPKNVEQTCSQTTSAMSFPSRNLNGLTVYRSVSGVGGRVRWLDSIYNPGPGKVVSIDFGLEVLGSQVIATSESGNDSADGNDHWTVHNSQNKLFGALQWGQDGGATEPAVIPEDGGPRWEDDFGTMSDDATLRYQVFVGQNQTVRLLHVAGSSGTQAASVAIAQDSATPFSGYSKAVAQAIVNWGPDPDGDGVAKTADACPGVPGVAPTGCPADIAPGPGPAPDDPVNPEDPAAPLPGTDPAAPGGGTDPGTTPPAVKDTTGPGVTLKGLGTKVRRRTITGRKGAAVRLQCTESCRFTARLEVQRKGAKKATTVLTVKQPASSTATRTFRLRRIRPALLRRLARQRATLVIRAVDGAGNVTLVRRTLTLR